MNWISRLFGPRAVKPSDRASAPKSSPDAHAAPSAESGSQSPRQAPTDSQPSIEAAAQPDPLERRGADLAELQSRLKQADALERAGRIDEAEAAYQECLAQMERERSPVTIDLLIATWMGLGFCRANRKDWPCALAWYEKVEECLHEVPSMVARDLSKEAEKSPPRWYRHVPKGVAVLFPKTFDWMKSLANAYDSIAIAFDNNKELETASEYFGRSAALFRKIGDLSGETQVWFHRAMCAGRREQWNELGMAAETMRAIAEEAKDRGAQLKAYRLLATAHTSLRQFKMMFVCNAQAVVLARELKDADVANDEQKLLKLVGVLRPNMIDSGEIETVELLVAMESLIGAPNLAKDEALLKQLRGQGAKGTQ